jgi:hypothetical protein
MRFAAKVLNFGYGLTEFWDVIRLHQTQFFNDVHSSSSSAGAQHAIHGVQHRIHALAMNLGPSGVNLCAVRRFVVASSRRVFPRCQVAGHATEGFRLYLVPLKVAQMHFGLLVYPAGFASRSACAPLALPAVARRWGA